MVNQEKDLFWKFLVWFNIIAISSCAGIGWFLVMTFMTWNFAGNLVFGFLFTAVISSWLMLMFFGRGKNDKSQ